MVAALGGAVRLRALSCGECGPRCMRRGVHRATPG